MSDLREKIFTIMGFKKVRGYDDTNMWVLDEADEDGYADDDQACVIAVRDGRHFDREEGKRNMQREIRKVLGF